MAPLQPRIEKTVFISYRRVNGPWALAIYKELTHHGYDVFFDFSSLDSGDFDSGILGNVRSRAHFLILLTPSALERCDQPGDWLRGEIEEALRCERNVVPLMLEGFDFGAPAAAAKLTGVLQELKRKNGITVSLEYFDAAMDKLRTRFLSREVASYTPPAAPIAQQTAADQKALANAAPAVPDEVLQAQQYFERAVALNDPEEEIRLNTEAIRLKPDFAEAFYNRGVARGLSGDLDGALTDYDEAIRLKPDLAVAFDNRGIARALKGDLDGALADHGEAIRRKPDFANAFYNRGVARYKQGDLNGALADYVEAIRLKPDDAEAFYNRANSYRTNGNPALSISDYQRYLDLGGGERYGDREVVEQRIRDLQKLLESPATPEDPQPSS